VGVRLSPEKLEVHFQGKGKQQMLKSMQEVLENAFNIFNEVYFENSLPPIVITIMSSPKTNGHFTINREWRIEQEHFNEINISAEHLDRPIGNICATLIHEMVHYYCQLNGINDTSQNSRYHNRNFKAEAEKRGLVISYAKYIGYSVTEPSQELLGVIGERNIQKPIDINRDGYTGVMGLTGTGGGGEGGNGADGAEGKQRKKTSTRKYVCPKCGNSFRATKDINVMCMDCNEQFVRVER
jgi:DNA-directed RNA polymerase subunit RPC12/RpoP